MNRVLRCFIRPVRRAGPVLVNYNHYGHLPSRGAITGRSVSIPGAILVKLNAPNQLLARPHNRPWWRVMKHCVPVTITGICVCKRRGELLSETGGAPPYLSLSLSLFPLHVRLGRKIRCGETQFTYSVKAIVIMLLTTARGTTPRRIGAFQRGE